MQLRIDTIQQGEIKLALVGKDLNARLSKKTEKVSESLLPEIEKFLKKHKVKLKDLERVVVNPGPGGFSSIRTGVAVVNALNFALGIEKIVLPKYDKEPKISKPRKMSSWRRSKGRR
jgi:tRNA A37 threonylcarbamoyladenosine modification protein TsaB